MTSTRVSVIATFHLFPLGGFLFQKPAALAGPTVRRHRKEKNFCIFFLARRRRDLVVHYSREKGGRN